jgi:hypothetical protein
MSERPLTELMFTVYCTIRFYGVRRFRGLLTPSRIDQGDSILAYISSLQYLVSFSALLPR